MLPDTKTRSRAPGLAAPASALTSASSWAYERSDLRDMGMPKDRAARAVRSARSDPVVGCKRRRELLPRHPRERRLVRLDGQINGNAALLQPAQDGLREDAVADAMGAARPPERGLEGVERRVGAVLLP